MVKADSPPREEQPVAPPDKPTSRRTTGGGGSNSRRHQQAAAEAARRSGQRRRTAALVAICVVLAMALLSYPVYLVIQDSRASNTVLADLGVAQSDAGCDPVTTNPASGNQNHVADGTPVTYDPAPPDSGPHYASPAPFSKRFYTVDDRPAVATLVHNLEHGYTVAWYRPDAPPGDVEALQAVAKTFTASDYDPTQKFIAAPWTSADGAFPTGKNLVLAHWTADPAQPADTTLQQGVQQACATVSGAAVGSFLQTYPSTSSPEPNGA